MNIPKTVGNVIHAYWDESLKGVRFTIELERWRLKLQGTCKRGSGPKSGEFISPVELKAIAPELNGQPVYDESGYYSGNSYPPHDTAGKIQFALSLTNRTITIMKRGKAVRGEPSSLNIQV